MEYALLKEQRSQPVLLDRQQQVRQHARTKRRRRVGIDLLFIAPALLLFTMVVIYPITSGLFYGFTDWDGISPLIHFIGLTNFIKLFQDSILWTTVFNTLVFAVLTTVIQMSLGLILALALHGKVRLFAGLRVLFLMPIILGGLAVALAFSYIYNPSVGLLDNLLAKIGLGSWVQDWLGNVHLVMGSVIAANVWQWTGFTMIIFLAGLQMVPDELHQAARLDGATSWQRFWKVTWPLLAPSTTINLLLTIVGSLKVFDIILALTGGGPGYSSESIVVYVYSLAFNSTSNASDSYGYPAAMSLVLSIAILAISLGMLKLLRRREVIA